MLYLPLLIKRDGGFFCWYCHKALVINKHVYDHLDNNREHNEIENIVLACQSCNNTKPEDPLLNEIAMMKLEQNKRNNFLVGREKKFLKDDITKEASPEIEINVSNSEITEQFLEERIERDGYVAFSEALHCSVYLCKEKTGHGSQQSIRNYLKTLTCEVAPFMIIHDENNRKIIVRRNKN